MLAGHWNDWEFAFNPGRWWKTSRKGGWSTVDPMVLMESLFKLTELEIRFGLNMNVLSAGQIPSVLSLRDVLKHWLEHRQEVLRLAAEYGVSAERIRQIEVAAMKKMRTTLAQYA